MEESSHFISLPVAWLPLYLPNEVRKRTKHCQFWRNYQGSRSKGGWSFRDLALTRKADLTHPQLVSFTQTYFYFFLVLTSAPIRCGVANRTGLQTHAFLPDLRLGGDVEHIAAEVRLS
ncbi:hypothetical protein K443DRAFT_664667 [Laccaria amethystina LaAM-08-1]|uniref:Uncharacterized protein n=1 Tax=Laccaria amethystina LaAM-08-1 TaxID=1095629 RepID=A0A0C9WKZ8_9AGAR|nr:hypothetical protein K443DRAFT_664667 [Laccaria amethystina LaAM-08-1]